MNLGSGESGRKGWVNVDANRFEGVDLVWDLREPLPLPDGCAQCILSEHVLEHLGYPAEATAFLKECRRLLRTGGVLRLLVPDALKYCRVLVGGDWEGARRLRHVEGCRTLMEMVNDVFRQRYEHQFAYDEETLKLVLKDAGFSEVRRMNYGESRMEGLAAEQQWRAEESLCVEAVKGA
jgi:predicted SAM-dependent methyltransferase